MEGEQFSLCWNNFHTNLSAGFQSLFKDEDLVDCTLAADGRFLKAHKTVLSVCSPFFKDLFRVNPCKHPIVILPDVNYAALCHLLHFMYQGEVSVSQEEIPTFMRVAQMLKVKGLTDNSTASTSNDATNGFQREKDVKRPLNTPKVGKQKTVKSLPPAKRPHLDTPPLVTPKQEPIDDEDSVEESEMNEPVPSPSHQFPKWPAPSKNEQADCSTPGTAGLVLLKSGRGQFVMVHNGHIYTLSDRHEHIGTQSWVCVKKKTLNCDGTLTTLWGPTLISSTAHNHPQLNEVIKRLQVPNSSISPELL